MAAVGVSAAVSARGQAIERVTFSISARSTDEALIQLALQAGISIGGAKGCHGLTQLQGRMSVADGLSRLLAGSACRYTFIDARTVRVTAQPAETRRAPPQAAPPPPGEAAAPPAPSPPPPDRVEELEVTSAKRPGYVGQLPGAIEVLGGLRLEDTGVTDTDDVARQSASFITTNLGPARNKILLRGLSDGAFTGRTQSTVGTYLNDVPVTYNAPDPDLRLVDVQAVEILRGPQGALYGDGSLSGVYRIVTRKPEFDAYSFQATGQTGATQGGAPSYGLDVILNAVLVPGQAAGRVVLYDDRQGGYLHDDDLRLSNVDLTERAGGRAAVSALLGRHWTVTLNTAVQRLNSADTQYLVRVPGAPPRRSNQVRETHRNDFGEITLHLSGDGGWGALESSTAYVSHRFSSRFDASSVLNAFDADPADDVGLFDESSRVRMLTQDVYWSSREAGRLHYMLGAFGSVMQEDSPSSLRSRRPSGAIRPLYQEMRRDTVDEAAVYGEAAYDLGPGWTLTAGGRAFQTWVHTDSDVTLQRPSQARQFDHRQTFAGLSPKLALQKQTASGAAFYALASAGYRGGGFNTGGLAAPTPGTVVFKPDRLENFEVGGVLSGMNGRLNLRSALFYDRWTDIQTDQYLPSGLSYTANVGDGRNLGLEAEVGFQATPNLKLQANMLLDKPRITSLTPGSSGVVGASLPGVPNSAFAGLVSYRRPLSETLAIMATAEAAYTGSSRLTFDSRYSPVTPSNTSVNLSFQLVSHDARAAVFISNPFNTSQDTFAYGNPFSFGQVRQVTPQRPRTISLVLTKRIS